MEPKRHRHHLQHADPAPQWASHLLDLPQELLAAILGMFMKFETPWTRNPRTLAEVTNSVAALEEIRKRAFVIRLVFHKKVSSVGYGTRRLYVTSCMIHILRRQRMLLERHHSIHPHRTEGPAMLAIYEATYYETNFVNQMVRDGIKAPEQYRFVLERLKAVQSHPYFEGFVGGKHVGLLEVEQA